MEEIRKTITKLQENIKELAIADEAIKDVVRCNSKNLDALKNYTLEINERVKALEECVKGKKAAGDIIIEEMSRVKEDLANLHEKIDNVEETLLEDIESKAARLEENISTSCGKTD